jgi:hypothetical protein
MSDSAELDEQISLMRIAVINATFERLRYMQMPERVGLLVRSGWADEIIFKQITSEQPLTVKIRLGSVQAFRFIRKRRIAFALLAVALVTAYFGRDWMPSLVTTTIEAVWPGEPATTVEPAEGELKLESPD